MMKSEEVVEVFGKRIEELRNLKGWSQAELARKFGTSAPIVGRYERGTSAPTIGVARRIADSLEVTLDYMTDPKSDLDSIRDQDMLNRLNEIVSLPNEDKAKIIDLVDALIRDSKARAAYSNTKRKTSA